VEHDPAEVIAAAFDQAEARDPDCRRRWVVLVDGAGYQLDLIHAEAARRGVQISAPEAAQPLVARDADGR
jgi:hypothetical protein